MYIKDLDSFRESLEFLEKYFSFRVSCECLTNANKGLLMVLMRSTKVTLFLSNSQLFHGNLDFEVFGLKFGQKHHK